MITTLWLPALSFFEITGLSSYWCITPWQGKFVHPLHRSRCHRHIPGLSKIQFLFLHQGKISSPKTSSASLTAAQAVSLSTVNPTTLLSSQGLVSSSSQPVASQCTFSLTPVSQLNTMTLNLQALNKKFEDTLNDAQNGLVSKVEALSKKVEAQGETIKYQSMLLWHH